MQHKIIKLDDKEKKQLTNMMEYQGNSLSLRNKAKVILMRARRASIPEVMKETKLSKRTIINYENKYLEDKRFFIRNNYKKSDLINHKNVIIQEFRERPAKSYKEATSRIKELFGIERSITQVRVFLNKHNVYTVRSEKMLFIQRQRIINTLKKNKDY